MIQQTLKVALLFAAAVLQAEAFAPAVVSSLSAGTDSRPFRNEVPSRRLNRIGVTLRMSDEEYAVDATQERIAALVAEHPVLLFMKGSKLFPQCGFSNTASQILQSYNIDFHTVDVLADASIRQGIKEFSQWPTIPQLFVCGEFIGGSDIMIEMYQSGELGEMIEKARADMI